MSSRHELQKHENLYGFINTYIIAEFYIFYKEFLIHNYYIIYLDFCQTSISSTKNVCTLVRTLVRTLEELVLDWSTSKQVVNALASAPLHVKKKLVPAF